MIKHLHKYIVEMFGESKPEVWWKWHLKTCNGRIIATSKETYINRTVCRNVCKPLAIDNGLKFVEIEREATNG